MNSNNNTMFALLVCLGAFLILLLGYFIFKIILEYHECNVNKEKNKNNQIATNSKIKDKLKSFNFNISKIYYLNDYSTIEEPNDYKKFIAIDKDEKKVCFVDYKIGTPIIVEFKDIVNYEVYENSSTATVGGTTNYGSGNFIYASSSKRCRELRLIIRLKNLDMPQISYEIISHSAFNRGYDKSSELYEKCISSIQEVVSFLEVIKSENSNKLQ